MFIKYIKQNIPNFFTLCNLLCGCIAVVFAFEGSLVWSSYLVGVCCLFDFLDGLAARLLKVHSEIGKQLDSLADMVSFGVVPGVMMYKIIYYAQTALLMDPPIPTLEVEYSADDFYLTPYFSFLIPVFSAIRLAKFNLDEKQKESFTGLPTPANTIFITSLVFIYNYEFIRDSLPSFVSLFFNPYFPIFITLISSISLISPISLFALKFKNFSWEDNKIRYVFLLLSLALLIIFRLVGIPLIIVLYIILSVINNLTAKNTPANYE